MCLPWCLPPTGTAQFPPQLPPPPVRRAESGWFNFLRRFPPPGSPSHHLRIPLFLNRPPKSPLYSTVPPLYMQLNSLPSSLYQMRPVAPRTIELFYATPSPRVPWAIALVPSWFRAQIYTTPTRMRHWRTWQKGGESLCDKVEKSKRKVPKRDDRLRVARAILDQWGGDRAPNLCVSFTCSFYVH